MSMEVIVTTWNNKQPVISDCFNWMILNLYIFYIENGFSPKHPFINGCLGFQAVTKYHQNIPVDSMTPFADLYLFLWSLSSPSRFSFQTGVTCVAGTHVHFLGINL